MLCCVSTHCELLEHVFLPTVSYCNMCCVPTHRELLEHYVLCAFPLSYCNMLCCVPTDCELL